MGIRSLGGKRRRLALMVTNWVSETLACSHTVPVKPTTRRSRAARAAFVALSTNPGQRSYFVDYQSAALREACNDLPERAQPRFLA